MGAGSACVHPASAVGSSALFRRKALDEVSAAIPRDAVARNKYLYSSGHHPISEDNHKSNAKMSLHCVADAKNGAAQNHRSRKLCEAGAEEKIKWQLRIEYGK